MTKEHYLEVQIAVTPTFMVEMFVSCYTNLVDFLVPKRLFNELEIDFIGVE